MSAQQSLLQLFEQQFAAKVGPRESDVGATRESPVLTNPFRKQSGICTRCTHGVEREQRIYFCHICNGSGCWEWLQKHRD